jgi:hypothetical protein
VTAIANLGPNVPTATMLRSMRQVYDTVGIRVELGSTQNMPTRAGPASSTGS